MRISGFQWFLCGLAAIALHAALFLVIRPPSSGAEASQPAGPAIEMSGTLAGIIGAPVDVDTPDAVDVIQAVEPVDVSEPDVIPAQVAMTAPVPPPADLPDLVQIPTSEPVQEIETKELPAPVVKVKPVETKPEPKKREPPKKKTAKKKTEPKKKKAARKGNSKSGAGGTSRGGGGKGKARASSAAIAAYGGKVRSRVLSRAPRGGAGRGTVTVSFSISSSGGLSSARVSRSSGNPGLDAKALSAVRSASPFPAPPAGARRTFSIPFRFR